MGSYLPLICNKKTLHINIMGFARGSSRSVLLAFSQSYVEHDLKL
jgi:hypothetical protein